MLADGGDQTLLSNITSVYAGVNDLQTAEYVSAGWEKKRSSSRAVDQHGAVTPDIGSR